MKRSQKVLVGVGVGVLVLGAAAAIAGPVIYRDLIAAPAADTPTLSGDANMLDSSTASGSPLDPTQLAGTWKVSSGSEAGYRVNEVLNGTDVTVTGRTNQVDGTFTIDNTGLTLQAADLTVDVASIATDSGSRDAYFRDQALRTAENPTATFKLTTSVTLKSAPNSGDVVKAEATGDLTIAGVTKPVTTAVEVRSDGTTAEIAGSIPITFQDFGVTAPNLGFVSVEPTGFVEFQLNAAH
ncbi:YceI family protein [Leucobacter coleopterorum]|uniref:YceI family protein n=1 Tax=Leucobacter coleopterorum TaxID=2714933 RepID=A0ABX6JUF6_9MICO|nr:YceI family protein [Leucobacter coleopterorum]QIM17923.1 YceI family protein [Leucobacter coleopterorum]